MIEIVLREERNTARLDSLKLGQPFQLPGSDSIYIKGCHLGTQYNVMRVNDGYQAPYSPDIRVIPLRGKLEVWPV